MVEARSVAHKQAEGEREKEREEEAGAEKVFFEGFVFCSLVVF